MPQTHVVQFRKFHQPHGAPALFLVRLERLILELTFSAILYRRREQEPGLTKLTGPSQTQSKLGPRAQFPSSVTVDLGASVWRARGLSRSKLVGFVQGYRTHKIKFSLLEPYSRTIPGVIWWS